MDSILPKELISDDTEAWKRLDEAVKTWIIKSQFEKDMENYQKLKDWNDSL